MTVQTKAKFDPGIIVATAGFARKVPPNYAMAAMTLHLAGHWGTVDEDDAAANDNALAHGGRLLSVYPLPDDAGNFWIITEADRSVTTYLLPEEY